MSIVNIGDVILVTVDDAIERVEVIDISPSGKFIEVENDEWTAWIRLLAYLETLVTAEVEYDDGDGELDLDDDDPARHIDESVVITSTDRWNTGKMKT